MRAEFSLESLKGGYHSEELDVDDNKMDLHEIRWESGTGFISGPFPGCCVNGDEHFGFHNRPAVFDQLSDYQLFKWG
jgi:hypothetical protein